MKNKTKWIAGAILILLLALVGLYWYYTYVIQDQESEKNAAILRAKQSGGLVSTTKTWKSIWDQAYWVVQGKNKQNQDIMVWVQFQIIDGKPDIPVEGAQAVHTELLKDGVDEQKMRAIIAQQLPQAEIARLQPGVLDGQYVWQLLYKDETHHYYRFYRFTDANLIGGQYTIPNS